MAAEENFVFEDLRRTIIHARLCDEVWWLLEGTHPERAMIVTACNRHLNFFQTLRPSMFVTFIITLSSLFDQRKDSISLRSLPELAAHASFQELWARGRRLYSYRSKAIAHRDVQNDTTDYARATGFTYTELRDILKDTSNLFDDYASKHNLPKLLPPQFSSSQDLLHILRKLAT